ncbi:MAG: hypothetical protein IJ867_06405 [Clostridia bacterium]|nr:hypothetical protein [Clostridia bacterium]
MKGTLANFEYEVNNTIKVAYKNYRNEFKEAIGYVPKENSNQVRQARPHEYDSIEER